MRLLMRLLSLKIKFVRVFSLPLPMIESANMLTLFNKARCFKLAGICMFVDQLKRMRLKGKIPLLFVAALSWVVIISSCANIGMPTGGPKDSVPPVLLETTPEYQALNYKGKDARFTFNEYILPDEISETLVISPPLTKRPIIKTKSKTLIVQFNQELKDSTTYSLDFKNSVVDNNEKNPLENLRFSFSTGPVLDSLRIAGQAVGAFDMEPLENLLVLLQSNLHDSAVFKVIPDYIAKTDEYGMFMMDNISPGEYHVFAINDANNDMLYNEGAEEIAFVDDIIVPRAEFHASSDNDTIVNGLDSMLVLGHTHFYPDPLYLRFFMEDIFEQYLESSEREARNKCLFIFNESVKDTFNVRLLDHDVDDWNLMEYNQNVDSIVMWITDTTISKYDSLYMELSYLQLDSAGMPFVYNDTLLMKYTAPKVNNKRRGRRDQKEEEEGPEPVRQFNWDTNISGKMELYGTIRITAPEPVARFDSTMVNLYLAEDTLKTPLDFNFSKSETAYRTYNISYDWEPSTKYKFTIDSAACFNIYGISSRAFSQSFETREEDYYGSLTFEFSNVGMPMIVQLLKNSDEEEVLRQKTFNTNGTVEFAMLPPEKYKVKIIYDANGNGKWDTGSYQDKYQPERVSYVNDVIKLRSNWSETHQWDVTINPSFQKDIVDKELEEQKRKEEEEKAKKEQQQEQQQNNMFRPGGSSGRQGIQRR